MSVEVVRERVEHDEVDGVHDPLREGALDEIDAAVEDRDRDLLFIRKELQFLLELIETHVPDAPGHVVVFLDQLLGLYDLRELDLEDFVEDDVVRAISLFQGLVGGFRGVFRVILQEVPAVVENGVIRVFQEVFVQLAAGTDHDAAGLVNVRDIEVFPALFVRKLEHGILYHLQRGGQKRLCVFGVGYVRLFGEGDAECGDDHRQR